MNYLEIAIEAALGAGRVLLDHVGRPLAVQTKSSAIDLVTVADRAAESVLLAHFAEATPNHSVLAEESGAREGEKGAPTWVIDPLDGTTNFAHGLPHYSVSIGLVVDGQPVLGVVHDPSRSETFAAERGSGAILRTQGVDTQLRMTAATTLSESLLATGFGYDRATSTTTNVPQFSAMIGRVRGIRRAGSAALDLAWVAAGRLDGYWEFGLAPWDWCAGSVLVSEAGGVVATVGGEPWALQGKSVCVGNAPLVGAMREVMPQ